MVNGTNRCNGRVEVYNNGQWKHICNSDWGKEQAGVVCREINCGTPIIQPFYQNLGEASIVNGLKSTCSGNETSISQCTFQEFKERCDDATVLCSSMSLFICTCDASGFIVFETCVFNRFDRQQTNPVEERDPSVLGASGNLPRWAVGDGL